MKKKFVLPSNSAMEIPLLSVIYEKEILFEEPLSTTEAYPSIAKYYLLSREHLSLKMKDGRNHFKNRVQFAKRRLVDLGFVKNKSIGKWVITDKGKEHLKNAKGNKETF